MNDSITCPGCDRRLQIDTALLGQLVQCPSCQTSFRAGDPPPAEHAPPAVVVVPPPPTAIVLELPSSPSPSRAPIPTSARRPARRKAREPEHESGWKPVRVVGLVLAAVAVVVTITISVSWFGPPADQFQPNRWPVRQADDLVERRKEKLEPGPNKLARDANELAPLVKPTLDKLGEALAERKAEKIAALFDFERLHDEFVEQKIIPEMMLRNRTAEVRQMREGLGQMLARNAEFLNWRETEIRSVKLIARDDVAVIARHTTGDDGSFLRMRWWLVKSGDGWKVYDYEDLSTSLRFTLSVGVMLQEANQGGAIKENSARLKKLGDVRLALNAQNYDKADEILKSLGGKELPRMMEALRHLFEGLVQSSRGNAQLALEKYDAAHRFHADMPCLDLFKGVSHNVLGNWAAALKHLDAYQALLGDDSLVCYERGEALRGLSRFKEAAESYRVSLKYNPRDANVLLGLLRAMDPDESRDELAERFAKLGEHHKSFDLLADDCRSTKDGAALEPLALAMRKIDPNHPKLAMSLALAKAWNHKPEEAAALFEAALAKSKDQAARRIDARDFQQAMADGGHAALAYPVLPDALEAFRELAGRVRYNHDEMRMLVKLHARKHPGDPLLKLHEADLLASDGLHAQAAKAFEAAAGKAPDAATLRSFLPGRVSSLYHTGRAKQAYEQLAPGKEVFQQLASLCLQERKHDLLQSLLEKHAKAAPNDDHVATVRIQLSVHRKKHDEAIALFKQGWALQPDPQKRRMLLGDFTRAMADAGKALEAYLASPDPREALMALADDLLEMNQLDTLRKVLDAHAKREPDDLWHAHFLADLLAMQKDWKGALEALSRIGPNAPQELRDRSRHLRIEAMYRNGQGLKALAEIEPRKQTYESLLHFYLFDKDAAGVDALIEAHRPGAGDDSDFVFDQARAKLLAKKADEAVRLFQQACKTQSDKFRVQGYVQPFVMAMADQGLALEGYLACPDRPSAFKALAPHFLRLKKDNELEQLLQEHGRKHAKDASWHFHNGELHLLRNDAAQAEKSFLAALALPMQRFDKQTFQSGVDRARLKLGRLAESHLASAGSARVFENLASMCALEKDEKQLAALVAAHREKTPDDPSLAAWELDLQWLRKDYAGLVKKLEGPREGPLSGPRWSWKADRLLVLSLVKLDRIPEALKRAEAREEAVRNDDFLALYVVAASGDVKAFTERFERKKRDRFFVEDCYRDAELSPILRSEAFALFRAKHPEPKPGDLR